MTITTTTSQVSIAADGQQTVFAFNFFIPEGALRVYLTENDAAVMVSPDEYAVSGFDDAAGGFVKITEELRPLGKLSPFGVI